MIKAKGKSCFDDEDVDTWDYNKNITVKNRDIEIPKSYTIYLFHELDANAINYKPYFDVFDKAKENDEITIYFQSGGGSVSIMNMFLNAIRMCKCKTITARVNYAASASAIIALACDRIMFNDNATLMLHTFSTFDLNGKRQELLSYTGHSDKTYRKMTEPYLKKILSEDEIEEMSLGRDFYFDTEEAIERIKKYSKKKAK